MGTDFANSSSWAACASGSKGAVCGTSPGFSAISAGSFSRFPVQVRHQPQSAPSTSPNRPVSITSPPSAPPDRAVPTGTPASRCVMSCASLAFSWKICSLDSSKSAGSRVSEELRNDGRKSSVWHITSRSTMTSTGRPDGAMKYICRSPFRLLNIRSAVHPLRSR
ncbi:MAG TPA: hypothetical protein VK719_02740 [Trebonia sp.]|nr:hypothetical protein [Trebonia sp.]